MPDKSRNLSSNFAAELFKISSFAKVEFVEFLLLAEVEFIKFSPFKETEATEFSLLVKSEFLKFSLLEKVKFSSFTADFFKVASAANSAPLGAELLLAMKFERSRVEFKASDETKREVEFLVSKEVKFCAFDEAISGADVEFKASGAMGSGVKEAGLKHPAFLLQCCLHSQPSLAAPSNLARAFALSSHLPLR